MNMNLGCTALIIECAQERGVLRNQLAYILATAYWESGRTMKPVREYGGEAYLKKKRYYPYVGMGLVQLTWKRNYQLASKKFDIDFVSDPKLLLKEKYAVPILVVGMIEGWFTGKGLSDYITLRKSDFVNARRIINGVDKKHEIAKIAEDYDSELKAAGYGIEKNLTPRRPKVTQVAVDAAATDRTSTTGIATTIGVATNTVATGTQIAETVSEAKSSADMLLGAGPWFLLLCMGAGVGWYIWKERKRKRKEAREALK